MVKALYKKLKEAQKEERVARKRHDEVLAQTTSSRHEQAYHDEVLAQTTSPDHE